MVSYYGFITIKYIYTSSINSNFKKGGCSKSQLLKNQIIIEVSLLAQTMVSVSTTHEVNLGLFGISMTDLEISAGNQVHPKILGNVHNMQARSIQKMPQLFKEWINLYSRCHVLGGLILSTV